MCSRYAGREQELPKSFPAVWDRNGNYQKAFPLFGMGTGNPKKSSRCLGTGIQGVPVGKYTGTGIPAHAWDCAMILYRCKVIVVGLWQDLRQVFITVVTLCYDFRLV